MVRLTCKTCGTALPCHRWRAKPRPARAAGNPACRLASRSGRGWRSGERRPRRPRRRRTLRSDTLFAAQRLAVETKRRGFLTARLVGPHHLPPEVQHRLGVGQPRRADQPCPHRLLLALLEECNPGGSNDRASYGSPRARRVAPARALCAGPPDGPLPAYGCARREPPLAAPSRGTGHPSPNAGHLLARSSSRLAFE